MSYSTKENVCSVTKEDNSGYYRLHTIWETDTFSINITSKNGAWCGEMTETEIQFMSNHLELDPQTYLKHCKEALSTHQGLPGFVYSVENGTFTWKKIVDEDSGIKIIMGTIKLQPASFIDTIQSIVEAALNCSDKLQKEVAELRKEKQKQIMEKESLSHKLDELIRSKDDMETDLYSRFILLLNSKKKKIAELETALRKMEKEKQKMEKDSECDAYQVETDEDISEDTEKLELTCHRLSENTAEGIKETGSEQPNTSAGKEIKNQEVEAEEGNEASTSRNVLAVAEEPPSKRDKIPSTKDELLEYFYGA
ncbi:hypothetical protein RUM43_007856 [Polyplax serrata]|uniref:XRCC4 n=1 Tax=Polyplax serrata TaxID=468196 RepID=A0AAN8Q6I5_POLSC